MKIRTLIPLALVFSSLALVLSGQAVYVLRDPGLAVSEGYYLPSAQYPTGANAANPHVPTLGLPHFFGGAAAPALLPGQGGHAIDQQTGRMISSDGLQIWEEPHPRYPVPFVPNPPIPAPVITSATSPLTGLGADSTHGVVWMCDVNGFQPFATAWPHAAVGGVVAPAFPHSQFTGIAYDTATGTIWLCDIQGCVYNCTVFGAPIGAQPVACVPASLKGIVVNGTNGVGSVPPPGCSTQIGGLQVLVTDGVDLFDALSGANFPLATPGNCYGLAYSADGQYSFGGSPWVASGMLPSTRLARPATNAGPVPLRLAGALPGGTAHLLWAPCPLTAPLPCGLGAVRVWGGGIVTVPIDAVGRAQVMLPLGGIPAGIQFTTQWAFGDPAQPCGWVLSDAMTITVGLP